MSPSLYETQFVFKLTMTRLINNYEAQYCRSLKNADVLHRHNITKILLKMALITINQAGRLEFVKFVFESLIK